MADKLNLALDCKVVAIEPAYGHKVKVDMVDIDTADIENSAEDILRHIPNDEIVNQIGVDDLLDEIGRKQCLEHFNVPDPEGA